MITTAASEEGIMGSSFAVVERTGRHVTITMDRPDRRNALSEDHLLELIDAFRDVGAREAAGVILAATGPVFCSGHDYADIAGRDAVGTRRLFATCAELMRTMQSIPQPVLVRVHGLATAAGCQLVAEADLAVAAETAGFATPGGRGGSFCHTPLVAVSRVIGRRRALEMGMTGEPIDAHTAEAWGLVNRVVPDDELDAACLDLLDRATQGSRLSKGLGKNSFYSQLELDQAHAYALAVEARTAAGQTEDGREHIAAFLGKRAPRWTER
jgi:enoyl-CoA hydratase/carnithine racemase